MEFRVRKHVKNISRSLEKICDIIDEYAEDHPSRGGVIPDFLGLLPMRYRAGGCVIELTAMV
jgi:hypothetical protein